MKITEITVHQVDLPLREGTYSWSGGKSIRTYDSTVVRIHTDEGVVGHGEELCVARRVPVRPQLDVVGLAGGGQPLA